MMTMHQRHLLEIYRDVCNSNIKIYNDMYAEKIITEDEYNEISTNMKNGISYYLDKETFKNIIKQLSNIIPKGSTILFDYPNILETKIDWRCNYY